MAALHWAEWVWLGAAVGFPALIALKLLLLHLHHSRAFRDAEPVDLGSAAVSPFRRFRREPIVVADGQRCPCCHGDLSLHEGLHRCGQCSTVLHWECHREFGCPTLGCSAGYARNAPSPVAEDDAPGKPPLKERA